MPQIISNNPRSSIKPGSAPDPFINICTLVQSLYIIYKFLFVHLSCSASPLIDILVLVILVYIKMHIIVYRSDA